MWKHVAGFVVGENTNNGGINMQLHILKTLTSKEQLDI
jgi:hypothetical protein